MKYQGLPKKAKAIRPEMENLKKTVSSLFLVSSDLDNDLADIQEIAIGYRDKERRRRIEELIQTVQGAASFIEEIRKVPTISQIGSTIVQVRKEDLRSNRIYMKLVNASSVSRLLPISGKTLSEDRLFDLLESKFFSFFDGVGGLHQLIGKEHELEAFTKVKSNFNGAVEKSQVWLNLDYPLFSSQPDGVIVKDGKIEAVVEIKNICSKLEGELKNAVGLLNKGSETGVRRSKGSGELEIRKGSCLYAQVQTQMLCTNAKHGYVVLYSISTGGTYTAKIDRDELFIKDLNNRAVASIARLWQLLPKFTKESPLDKISNKNSNEPYLALGAYLKDLVARGNQKIPNQLEHMQNCLP